MKLQNITKEYTRLNNKLYEILIIKDDKGKEVQRINIPLKVEFKIHDFLEVMVGASILAVPTAFTEEVWDMGDRLPWFNVILLSLVSLVFIGCFIYFTTYLKRMKLFKYEFYKRMFFTYFLSVLIVGLLLTIVDKCPWFTEFDVALKRVIIGAFPASLSATVTDNIS